MTNCVLSSWLVDLDLRPLAIHVVLVGITRIADRELEGFPGDLRLAVRLDRAAFRREAWWCHRPRNPTRVLISNGSFGPKTSAIFLRVSSLSTRCVFTRAIPSPDRPSTGPCRISLRIVKRSISACHRRRRFIGRRIGRRRNRIGRSYHGRLAIGLRPRLLSLGGISSSWPLRCALGFMASIHEPNASKVTTCSDLNQPPVHLRSTILRYGACSTSLSRPCVEALLGELADAPRRDDQQPAPARPPLRLSFSFRLPKKPSARSSAPHRARRAARSCRCRTSGLRAVRR